MSGLDNNINIKKDTSARAMQRQGMMDDRQFPCLWEACGRMENMKTIWKGRGVVLVVVLVLLVGVSSVFAAEDAVKYALSELYGLMAQNKTTASLDQLELRVLDNEKADADKDAAKILTVGVYEYGYDNTLTRDIKPQEVLSRIAQEKRVQAREPLVREGELYTAIESLLLKKAQQQTETRLLALTREEVAIAEARFKAGILSVADLESAKDAIASAEHGLKKGALSISLAELEVNRIAGMDPDTALDANAEILLLETAFADLSAMPKWEEMANAADPNVFAKSEALRILDLKLKTAKEFIPDTHSRVVQMLRDREDARLALKDAVDGIAVNLRNGSNDRLTSAENLEFARLELDLSKRKQNLAKTRYDAGVANKLDLISAEKAVVQAEQSVRSAIVSLNRNEVDLRLLVGLPVVSSGTAPPATVTTPAAVTMPLEAPATP